MNKTFALMLTLGVFTIVFAANDKPTTTPQSNFVQKREIVKEEASKVNEEVIRPAVQEVKKTASNLNERRKRWW